MATESAVDQGTVDLSVKDGIGTIEFFHPMSNSLPGKLLSKLADGIAEAGSREEIKVVVIRSRGDKAFCAGASFDELLAIRDFSAGKEFFSGFARVINAARKCPKFIIGRVHGKAVGGGVGMAAMADICFASGEASVKLSELAVGIGPFVVGPAVQRKTGLSAFSQMAINATRWYTAEWAREKGLYAEVFQTAGEMDEAISALAARLASSNPEAMRLLKETFWEGTGHWDTLLAERAGMSGKLVLSDFTVRAINAFRKK